MGDSESTRSERRVGPTVHAAPDQAEQLAGCSADDDKHTAWVLHYDSAHVPLSEDAEKGTTHDLEDEDDVTLDELVESLKDASRGDIVTTVFHTAFARVKGTVEAIGVTNSIARDAEICFLAPILGALHDAGPSAVVMCGCDTARFLKHIIRQGVPVAFGLGVMDNALADFDLTANVVAVDCNAAADAITASLMKGDPPAYARHVGNKAMASKANRFPIEVILEVGETPEGDPVNIHKSLRENGLLPKFRKP